MTDAPEWARNSKAGDQVVCIQVVNHVDFSLRKGEVYIIEEVMVRDGFNANNHEFVEGLLQFAISGHAICARVAPKLMTYCWQYFRPLVTNKSTTHEVAKLKRMAKEGGKVDA